MVKFKVKKKLPKIALKSEQKKFLKVFLEITENIKWDAEAIHNGIYEVSEKEKIPIKTAFSSIYQILLGQEKGPRVGFFLSNLDKDFVIERIKEVI